MVSKKVKYTNRNRRYKRKTLRKYNSKRRVYKRSRPKRRRYKKNTTKRKIYKKYKKVRSKRNLRRNLQRGGVDTYTCYVCSAGWSLQWGFGPRLCIHCGENTCKACSYKVNGKTMCMECFFIRKLPHLSCWKHNEDDWKGLLTVFRNNDKPLLTANIEVGDDRRNAIRETLVKKIKVLLVREQKLVMIYM